ncbi:macrophage migration inhibitory factor [Fusarium heterosporum]|uniref:L-dopachrome isomerase n=1 Tax=Fusarium heterosporum TaxID=42747 RepID=A0A8H5SW12_FUSHE|nr:macrophage migration inhibitory factor [Fusarium heterosporum]
MHLSPVMNMPYIPPTTSAKPANSKPRHKQEVPVPVLTLFPGERRIKPRLSKPSLDPVLESDQWLSRDTEQTSIGDVTKVTRKHSLPILCRRQDDFFGDVFTSRHEVEPGNQIRNESVILVEIKTNVIIEEEFIFITELSEFVSLRYNRPASCIMITLQHGVCMQFGGSSDPSYTMKIEALERDTQTAMNKLNIALLQVRMKQVLDIPASRGYVRFVPVAQDCVGWKGNTVAGEVAEITRPEQTFTQRRTSIRAPRRISSKVGF